MNDNERMFELSGGRRHVKATHIRATCAHTGEETQSGRKKQGQIKSDEVEADEV